MALSPDASLIRITRFDFIKLVTLLWSTADIFFREHFDHLVWKEPVIVPIGISQQSGTFGYMMVMPATKDVWARTTSMTAVINAVNGLLSGIDRLQHPSILSADRIQAMSRQILDVYSHTNGKAYPYHIAHVFVITIQQHI